MLTRIDPAYLLGQWESGSPYEFAPGFYDKELNTFIKILFVL